MSTSAVTIRSARESDFDGVAAVWHASASQQGVGPPKMPTLDDLRRRIDAEISQGWRLFVAVSNREIVGMLALKPAEKVLDQLFVHPSHIGTGLGFELFLRAKTELPLGFSLHTASTNDRARHFYQRFGMKFIREGPHPRTGHPVSHYLWNPS